MFMIWNKPAVRTRQLLPYWLTDYGIIGLADGSNSGRCQRGVIYFGEFHKCAELTQKNETSETFIINNYADFVASDEQITS